jgi:hypothetical protein
VRAEHSALQKIKNLRKNSKSRETYVSSIGTKTVSFAREMVDIDRYKKEIELPLVKTCNFNWVSTRIIFLFVAAPPSASFAAMQRRFWTLRQNVAALAATSKSLRVRFF